MDVDRENELLLIQGKGLSVQGAPSAKRTVGVTGFVFLGFFWVSGGMYGNEALFQAGPPLVVLIALILGPLIYALPIALMTAELGTVYPEDGGQIVFVREAFGVTISSIDAFCVWVNHVIDSAVYPIMNAAYLTRVVSLAADGVLYWFITLGIVLFVTFINLRGLDWIVGLQKFSFWASLAPCLIYMTFGSTQLDWSVLSLWDGDVDWVLLGSWILWQYSGFASLGVLAGEIENPKRTFYNGLIILFPLVIVVHTLPLAVAISQDPDRSHYIDNEGHFSTLAGRLMGPLLRDAFSFGSTVCLVGMYNGQIVIADETLGFLIEQQMKDTWSRKAKSSAVWEWLLERPVPNGTRRLYIIVNALLATTLLSFGMHNLVKFEMVLYAICEILFVVSFFVLQSKEKHRAVREALGDSVFLVPKRFLVMCYLAIPIALNVFYIIFTLFTDYRQVVATCAILACALISVFGLRVSKLVDSNLYSSRFQRKSQSKS